MLRPTAPPPLPDGVSPERDEPRRARLADTRTALSQSLLPWALTRVITLLALAFARFEVKTLHPRDAKAVASSQAGLLGADAGWYRSIAAQGYGISHQSLRFFPLLPGLTHLVHVVTAIPIGVILIGSTTVFSLAATALIFELARREIGDVGAARRTIWLFSLAPSAFVLVMGYSESLFIFLAAVTFLCLRRRWWWWAALSGFLAATARPIGFLLVLPAAIEAFRTWRGTEVADRAARVAAVVAPLLGLLAYLSWVAARFGGFFSPIRLQRSAVPASVSEDPFVNLVHDVHGLLDGAHIGSGLHIPWIVLAIALCVVAARKLPACYSVFAIAVVASGLASTNFESFERYALSAFPLFIGASMLLRSKRVEVSVYTLSAVALFGYALLAFLGAYVP
jgi:Mannosyltransferase (PIG-V)